MPRIPWRRSWFRGIVLFLSGVIAAWAAERYLLTGILVPVRVVSGSMAPAIMGPHGQTRCEDCRFRFCWDAMAPGASSNRVCPNCGAVMRVGLYPRQSGQRVLIRRFAYRLRRWDVVVVDSKQGGDGSLPEVSQGGSRGLWSVKRIVGLPGEQVALRNGDVWVDGQRLKKDWSTQRRVSLLVHDDAYRPARDAAADLARWQGDEPTTRWKITPAGYQWRLPEPTRWTLESQNANETDDTRLSLPADDWLTYRHWVCFASPRFRRSELPVRDDYGYNQGLSRQLHEVSDLLVHFRCQMHGPRRLPLAALHVRIDEGHGTLDLQWNADGEFRLTHERRVLWAATLPPIPVGRSFQVVAGVWDGQAVLVIDRVEQVRTDYGRLSHSWQPNSSPLAIQAIGWSQVDVTQLSVWRDIYYTHPDNLEADWALAAPLGPDEYLLLGDNSPVSFDGRHGRQHGVVTRNAILGCVFPQPNGMSAAVESR